MTISSRTPEGSPQHCPICGGDVRLEPSQPFGDAPCPRCGSLLWFTHLEGTTRLHDPEQASNRKEALFDTLADLIGVPREELGDDLAAALHRAKFDSLDTVELIMQLEEDFREGME